MESDTDLIARHLGGDEGAFAVLLERHLAACYSFAFRLVGNKEDAEDIVQESFLKAWKSLERYSAQSASFKTWCMRIVRNTSIDHLRKKKSIPFSHFQDAEGNDPFAEIADDDVVEEALVDHHDIKRIERAIAELPLHYREVMLLYLDTGSTLSEIADTLEVPVNTIKSRFRRAVAMLRQNLNPNGQHDRI